MTAKGCRVVPFGNPRVKGRLRLTGDYRSLPRPSSPPRAKASAVRPCTLLIPDCPNMPQGMREAHIPQLYHLSSDAAHNNGGNFGVVCLSLYTVFNL